MLKILVKVPATVVIDNVPLCNTTQTHFLYVSGGFYSDDVGYVASSCKKCPNGSYVPFNKAPGTQAQDCKTCPLGKQ